MTGFFSENKLLQFKVGCFYFQCEIKLIHKWLIFYNHIYSSLPRVPIIVEGAVGFIKKIHHIFFC